MLNIRWRYFLKILLRYKNNYYLILYLTSPLSHPTNNKLLLKAETLIFEGADTDIDWYWVLGCFKINESILKYNVTTFFFRI